MPGLFEKRMTRREAMTTGGKIVLLTIGTVGSVAVGGTIIGIGIDFSGRTQQEREYSEFFQKNPDAFQLYQELENHFIVRKPDEIFRPLPKTSDYKDAKITFSKDEFTESYYSATASVNRTLSNELGLDLIKEYQRAGFQYSPFSTTFSLRKGEILPYRYVSIAVSRSDSKPGSFDIDSDNLENMVMHIDRVLKIYK